MTLERPLEHNGTMTTDWHNAMSDVEQYIGEHPYGYQDENGIDLSLIWANLQLTPDQRVRQAQQLIQQLTRMMDARIPRL